MDRRAFVGVVVAGMIAAPLAANAQTATTVRRIATLSGGARPPPVEFEHEFDSLRELGWTEGKNLLIERRYANGRAELLRPFAEELVQLKVELIVVNGTAAALAARSATTTMPIILWGAGDPVGTGLVATLARPGGNITGMSIEATELDAKRLSLLRELIPSARRVGVLVNSTNPLFTARNKANANVYKALGLQPIIIEVATESELVNAIDNMVRQRAQAVVVSADHLFIVNRDTILRAALKQSLPAIVEGREMLEAGGLVSYAISMPELRRRVAAFIDRILRGASPADLPVEQPTKFELGVNLKTAKALGITIPKDMLLRADEVIQ